VRRDEYDESNWPDSRLFDPHGWALNPRVRKAPLLWRMRNAPRYWRGALLVYLAVFVAGITGLPVMHGALRARKIRWGFCGMLIDGQPCGLSWGHHDEAHDCGTPHPIHAFVPTGPIEIIDYGVVSRRVVTTAGVNFIVDAFQNSVEVENLKYHGYGTGGGAEAAANTALTTELTTEYATDNVRPTGTTTEGASANIYRTVATLDPDADVAITEHGIFSQAATGGGTLLDRSLFSVINLSGAGGDTLETTYDLTFTAGG